ncbi:MAG: hypothetical protein EPN70_07650 [Paraburkholderia sp.]|uniref:ATP-binding protein n=1 Tax=Paraburkholderia sp. TaxID=1926495 RepID=UPI0011F6B0BB|nr:ATP-binding protein [Paraburkholderia sp.]TAM05737.1 MAG: hypothetical protein EPN70_07650 [Paraburkholderia sp.]
MATANKPVKAWSDVFPNAVCVISLVYRFVHGAEVIAIKGESQRAKKARERSEHRPSRRNATRPEKKS